MADIAGGRHLGLRCLSDDRGAVEEPLVAVEVEGTRPHRSRR